MAKRMILMLAVTALFVAALGFVKFRQIQTAIAQGAAFQPPPEAVTTIVAQQEEWPATLSAIGTVAAVQGVTVSADLPGIVERIAFESGRSVREGDVLVQLDTRQEQAQLAAAEAQRDLARLNFERMQGLLNERRDLARGVRPRDGRTEADRGAGRRDPRHDRAQDDPRAVLGSPRHPPGQPRPVPVGRRCGRAAAVARSDLRELRRAAAGRRPGARRPQRAHHDRRSRRRRVRRPRHRDRLGRRRGDAQRPGAGDARQSRRQAAARDVRPDGSDARREPARSSRCRRPRSATRRTATRSSSSPT